MKKIIYIALASVLFASCTGVAPFSKQKYGHLNWIRTGGQVEEKTHDAKPAHQSNAKTATVAAPANDQKNEVVVNTENTAAQPVVSQKSAPTTQAQVNHTKPVLQPVKTSEATGNKVVKKHKAKRALVKAARKPAMDDDVRLILAVILAFLLPPVAVYLYRETGSPFALVLILCILSIALVWFIWYPGLLWLIAVVIALLTVLKDA
jgi:Ca2+-dependent lipid-binding protein